MKPINRIVAETPPSGIRRFFDVASQMPDAISLGVGEPDFVTPWRIREAAIYALERGYTTYTSNAGLIELRRAIAEHLDRLYGVRYDPDSEIVVSVGVSEGLDLALRAILNPGDDVIYVEPGYVSYIPCIRFAGATPVPVPSFVGRAFRVEAAEIEAAVTERTKAILICNPNNPTGAALTREDVEAIAQVAISHDLYVIADEIYDRLSYPGPHASMAAAAGARERTVLLNGFSKAYAMTGWRLGYVCATGEVAEAIARVHQYGMLCAPHIAQRAAIEALRCGEPDVREMIADYDRRRRYFVKGLNSIGLDCFDPAGAFYAFPSVHRTGLSSEAFAEALLQEERVVVVPGNAFGAAGEGFVRCCYATAMEQLEEALDRMRRFMERRLAPRPVRAARA